MTLISPPIDAFADAAEKKYAATRNLGELMWIQYPGHFNQALSKAIVTPATVGSRFFDHRISSYEPGAHVEAHVHAVQEQIYHVLSGQGLLIVDGERRLVRADDVTFIPPGVAHEFHCTGNDPLVFLVITSPPTDEEPQPR
ncbi:cupin domain-containing protein [Pinisolibacter aquiterrae]|uniref:cupin domain-containing protein n=1 Tax=Pinisolibacter aquiterrae TaxID=2815579 RepID=UPI001C3D9B0E|nr:cupin domain-containing protein [Pinisolibacter aquiterrae]MBV5265859.1 cupin domain-containing protein [Pinisolibacter aquiterrae]MCC8236576.1 cupin domain-containing protein [Pinisolibacter aquiterrae]